MERNPGQNGRRTHPRVLIADDNPEIREILNILLSGERYELEEAKNGDEAVWQEPYYYGANNTVMVHIRNLRRKIEKDPKEPDIIKTVWGRGYRCD